MRRKGYKAVIRALRREAERRGWPLGVAKPRWDSGPPQAAIEVVGRDAEMERRWKAFLRVAPLYGGSFHASPNCGFCPYCGQMLDELYKLAVECPACGVRFVPATGARYERNI